MAIFAHAKDDALTSINLRRDQIKPTAFIYSLDRLICCDDGGDIDTGGFKRGRRAIAGRIAGEDHGTGAGRHLLAAEIAVHRTGHHHAWNIVAAETSGRSSAPEARIACLAAMRRRRSTGRCGSCNATCFCTRSTALKTFSSYQPTAVRQALEFIEHVLQRGAAFEERAAAERKTFVDSASFDPEDKDAPSKPGIKHLDGIQSYAEARSGRARQALAAAP